MKNQEILIAINRAKKEQRLSNRKLAALANMQTTQIKNILTGSMGMNTATMGRLLKALKLKVKII